MNEYWVVSNLGGSKRLICDLFDCRIISFPLCLSISNFKICFLEENADPELWDKIDETQILNLEDATEEDILNSGIMSISEEKGRLKLTSDGEGLLFLGKLAEAVMVQSYPTSKKDEKHCTDGLKK